MAFKLRLLDIKITSLNTEGNLADKYHFMAAVRKKIKIKMIMITRAGGTTLIFSRVFRLYGLYTQF